MNLFAPFFLAPYAGQYRCHSVALMEGKQALENGGKIILPPSALFKLESMNVPTPMLFEVTGAEGHKTHCGVQEFIAPEGFCYLPFWMMQQLLVSEGGLVTIKSATLPKGTFTKLQPTDDTFMKTSNPKAILENALRNWATLTQDDTICVKYNSKNYYLKVLEVKPDTQSHAITIIDADVQVDFLASPQELAELTKQQEQRSLSNPNTETKSGVVFGSGGLTKGGQSLSSTSPPQPQPEEQPKFPGSGRRIKDGSPAEPSVASRKPVVSSQTTSTTTSTTTSNVTPSPSANAAVSRSLNGSGGMVFGSNSTSNRTTQDKGKEKEDEKTEEKPGWKAFSGTGYSLKG